MSKLLPEANFKLSRENRAIVDNILDEVVANPEDAAIAIVALRDECTLYQQEVIALVAALQDSRMVASILRSKMKRGYCGNCGQRLTSYEEQRWQKDGRKATDATCFECEPEETETQQP